MLKNNVSELEEISFGQIFRLILMQSKLVFIIILVSVAASIAYYLKSERIYKVTSLVQIYNPSSNNLGQDFALDFVLGSSTFSDAQSLQDLYLSRSNILKIIEENNLNLIENDLSANELASIAKFKFNMSNQNLERDFQTSFGEESYRIENSGKLIGIFEYDKEYETEDYVIHISNDVPKSLKTITYIEPEKLYLTTKKNFRIESSLPESSYLSSRSNSAVLKVSYLTKDREIGINVVDFANNLFISRNIEAESEQARKAISFIDDRIIKIEEDLQEDKFNLKNFRELNQTIDVDLEIQNIIASLSRIEQEINATDLELSKAANNYTLTNPIYLQLLDKKNTLITQKAEINTKIKELPLAQQSYIDLYQSLEITEQLYNELLNRKLEFSITEASTLGNMRVIDNAYYEMKVSPQISTVILFSLLSIIFAIFIAVVRGLYFLPISNPAEIADNGVSVPIVGVLPHVEDVDDIENLEETESERFIQSLESFIVNLDNQLRDQTRGDGAITLLITSPTASNGKSFLTEKLSTRLASIGNKVLLLDNDLKRGNQNKKFNKPKMTSEAFNKIDEENLEDLKVKENLYFIPKISRLTSSFQFLYSEQYARKLTFLKSKFDYVIIDTPPILSVSDTSMLMSHADLSFLVTRHGFSKMNEIKQAMKITAQIGIDFDGIVYNAYKRPSSYYGYYSLYGDYAYQYYAQKYLYDTYDYKNDKE